MGVQPKISKGMCVRIMQTTSMEAAGLANLICDVLDIYTSEDKALLRLPSDRLMAIDLAELMPHTRKVETDALH